jgi:hypothetical protein
VLLHLILVAVFGVGIPYWKGLDFLDPTITAAYACIGCLFAAPAAAQAFAASRPQSMKDAWLRVGRAILYGEGMAITFIVVGTLTVSLTHGPRLLLPELDVWAEASILGLAGTLAVSVLAGWATLRFSPMVARLMMRGIFLALLIAFFYNSRRLADVALEGSLLCLLVTAIAAFLLRKEVSPQ